MKYIISKDKNSKLVVDLQVKTLKEGCKECYDYGCGCTGDNDCPDPDCSSSTDS